MLVDVCVKLVSNHTILQTDKQPVAAKVLGRHCARRSSQMWHTLVFKCNKEENKLLSQASRQ